LICIDDVDEIGFSFSRFDRLFVNGIVAYAMRFNTHASECGARIRVLLSLPSELYYHSSLWSGDWVDSQASSLTWKNKDALKCLVNKRIAVELNVKSRKGRKTKNTEDTYSTSDQHTWDRIFPNSIIQDNRAENTFSYLIRHTFYTPRHILRLCDSILRASEYSDGINTKLIEGCVEDFCFQIGNDYRSLYSLIYKNLEQLMSALATLPNIVGKAQLLDFLEKSDLYLIRVDTNDNLSGLELVEALYRTGIFGFGVLQQPAPANTNKYKLRFSFINADSYRGQWDVIVFHPAFVEYLGMRRLSIPVSPDELLYIPHRELVANFNNELTIA
jgi:hypothetical protein